MTESSPRWPTIEALARELNQAAAFSDWAESLLEQRLVRLEEVAAAPWWRRPALARRLRRELRATDRAYREAAPDFRGRRAEWMSEQIDRKMTPRRRASS